MPRWIVSLLVITAMLLVSMAVLAAPLVKDQKLVVYSGRKETAIKPVLDLFTKETGIKVVLKAGKTGGLINELIQEKSNPQADVFISTTASAVDAAVKDGIFLSYHPVRESLLANTYKSIKGNWVGISGRARIIMYNAKMISKTEIPTSVFQLVDPKWKGKICISSMSERTTTSWMSSILLTLGESKTKAYFNKLVANKIKILPDNSDVIRAVISGEYPIGLTNSPNYYDSIKDGAAVGVVYPDQAKGQIGTLVNVNTASIVKGTKNLKAARTLLNWLLSKNAQKLLANAANEIPLIHGSVPASGVLGLNNLRITPGRQETLGTLDERVMALFPDFQ